MELECKGYIKRENRVLSFFKKYWVNVITVILCVACCFVSITQTKGIQGEQGIQGLQGIQGEKGEQGERGADGVNGKDGIDGKDGKDGVDGINGKDGINGVNGLNGIDGLNGKDGANGKDGVDGQTPYIKDGYWWVGEQNLGVLVGDVCSTWQNFEITIETSNINLLNVHQYSEYLDFSHCSVGLYDGSIEGHIHINTNNENIKITEAYRVVLELDNGQYQLGNSYYTKEQGLSFGWQFDDELKCAFVPFSLEPCYGNYGNITDIEKYTIILKGTKRVLVYCS